MPKQKTLRQSLLFACLSITILIHFPAVLLSAENKPSTNEGGAGNEYMGITLPVQPDDANEKSVTPLPASIQIKSDEMIGPLCKDIFGFNYWRFGLEGTLVNPETREIDPDAAKLFSGIPLPMNRIADMTLYRWKKQIGPMNERQPTRIARYPWLRKMKMGPIEWAQWLRSIDPQAGIAWVFNMDADTVEDDADLVEFFTGQPGHPRGQIDWAKRRQELGIANPVNVKVWELGNEMDWGKNPWTVEDYIQESRKIIKAIRLVDPQAKIAMHVLTAPNVTKINREFSGTTWTGWHRAILKALGSEIDYLSYHSYYSGLPTSAIEGYIDQIRDDIHQITGENRIKIYLSEHARWTDGPPENWRQSHDLRGCLATAQFLVRCMTRPEVAAASYHSGIDAVQWGGIFRDKDSGKLYSTGIADLFRMFAKLPDGNVVVTDVTGPKTNIREADLNFVATTVRSGQKLVLLVVNRGPARKAMVSVKNNKVWQLTSGYLFTAPTPDSFDTFTNHPITISPITIPKGEESLGERMIPAYSMTILEMEQKPNFR